jgi:hypothetical protein
MRELNLAQIKVPSVGLSIKESCYLKIIPITLQIPNNITGGTAKARQLRSAPTEFSRRGSGVT